MRLRTLAFKTVLVHVESTPESKARVGSAVELAGRWSAHLIGVGGCIPAYVQQPFVGAVDGDTFQIIDDMALDDRAEAEARFRRLAASLGSGGVWRSGEAYPDQVTKGFAAGRLGRRGVRRRAFRQHLGPERHDPSSAAGVR